VGAARTVEESERREMVRKVEVFIVEMWSGDRAAKSFEMKSRQGMSCEEKDGMMRIAANLYHL
jgi:hypothetical protein